MTRSLRLIRTDRPLDLFAFAWRTTVGAALSHSAAPIEYQADGGGVLVIGVRSADWLRELYRMRAELLAALAAAPGGLPAPLDRLAFVQVQGEPAPPRRRRFVAPPSWGAA